MIRSDDGPGVQPSNAQAELAKERNRAAAERTLMAWIRTCLALISFGFGIEAVLEAIAPTPAGTVRLSRIVGLAFIALGTYAMIVAAREHRAELRHIAAADAYFYSARRSLALTVAVGVICIGIVAFAGIIVQHRPR